MLLHSTQHRHCSRHWTVARLFFLSQLIILPSFHLLLAPTKLQQQSLCYSYGVFSRDKITCRHPVFFRAFSKNNTHTHKRRDTKHATKKDSKKNIRLGGKGEGGPSPSPPPPFPLQLCENTPWKKNTNIPPHTHYRQYSIHSFYYSVSPSCIAAASPRPARQNGFFFAAWVFTKQRSPNNRFWSRLGQKQQRRRNLQINQIKSTPPAPPKQHPRTRW